MEFLESLEEVEVKRTCTQITGTVKSALTLLTQYIEGEGLHCLMILPSDRADSFFTLGKNNLGRNKDMQRTRQEMKVIFRHVEIAISITKREKTPQSKQ